MSDDVVIRIEGLWKRYGLPLPAVVRKGLGWIRKGLNRKSKIENRKSDNGPWALRDITLEVHRGEILGIIGRNGAGKSTLLKVLAGVTPPTQGKVEVRGRIFSMIELNAGLHMELTGRENVRLLGAIMGLSRHEIEAKMPEIEDFCELGKWFDRQVRKYSSGMLARLGFAVAFNIEADVVLIDEVFAVGDMAFRQKCVGWLDRARRRGATTLFVSHNLNYIERLCSHALYLEEGIVRAVGEVKEACACYFEQVHDEIVKRLRAKGALNPIVHDGSREMRIVGVQLLDASGHETDRIYHQSDLCVRLELEAYRGIDNPCFTVIIVDQDMNPVAHATTLGNKSLYQGFIPGTTAIVNCWLRKINLLRGVYTIDAGIGDQLGYCRVDVVSNLAQFEVIYSTENYTTMSVGHFALPADWHIEISK